MKKIILFLAVILYSVIGFSQSSVELGTSFDVNAEDELDFKIVLMDNYNHYLTSYIDKTGMLNEHKIIVRKFDQTNQLVDTYIQQFAKIDGSELHHYLGAVELNNNEIAFFIETYSGKAKKAIVNSYVFDKKSNEFTVKELMQNPIVSAMKSGDVVMQVSENNKFILINHKEHSTKKDPETNHILVLNSNLDTVWKKDEIFTDAYYTDKLAVSNKGNVLFVRNAYGFKLENTLIYIGSDFKEQKALESKIMLQQPKIVSIGEKEYILCFNYSAKGARPSKYDDILFYDLSDGRIVNNSPISNFNGNLKLEDVIITNVFIQNNEIHFFAEVKNESEEKKESTFTNNNFADPIYVYGPAFMFVLELDGKLKQAIKLSSSVNNKAELQHTMGVLQINGDYFINSGVYSGFYKVDITAKEGKGSTYFNFPFRNNTIEAHFYDIANQLVKYNNDTKKLLCVRIYKKNQLTLFYVKGLTL